MKFAAFQRAVHSTEPRGTVIFTAPFVDVMPHIAAQAAGMNIPVTVYARGQIVPNAGNLDPDVVAKAEAEGLFDHPGTRAVASVPDLVSETLDNGGWLVVPDPTSIPIATWREIAKILLLATPSGASYLERRHFRLFTWVFEGVSLTQTLPPLICQYAFVVDNSGAVKTRAQLGPIFDGTTTMQGYRALADFSKNDADVQQNGYVQLLLATMKAKEQREEDRTPATDPQYINEVLFKLREQLILDQDDLVEAARRLDAEADAEFEREVQRRRERLGDDYDEQRDRHEYEGRPTAEKKLAESYEWVYHKALSWAVSQCPEADLSNVPIIPASDVTPTDVLWSRDTEEAHSAAWVGCDVTMKVPLSSFRDETAERIRRAFDSETARQAELRHPNVVQVYGVTQDAHGRTAALVMEHADGSLEQSLIASRFNAQRWTVAAFLDAFTDILRGLAYVSTHVIHRDVSLRSILRCNGRFKIGQFAAAIPVNYVDTEAKRGLVPVRWTAPEGFVGAFSPASDVFSFGILIWCATQYATAQPYADSPYPPDDIMAGKVPECPRQCPPVLYQLASKCMHAEATMRPTPAQLLIEVQHLRRTLPEAMLSCEVPFPDDEASFEERNEDRLAASTMKIGRMSMSTSV